MKRFLVDAGEGRRQCTTEGHEATPGPGTLDINQEDCLMIRVEGGMTNTLHRVAVILLALALAMVGSSRAMMLEQRHAVDSVEICAESGIETIFLDAEGKRTDAPMDCIHCPACLDNSAPVLMAALPTQAQRAARLARSGRPVQQAAIPNRKLRPETRGPPPANPEMHETAPRVAQQYAALRSLSGLCHRDGQSKSKARS